MEMYNPAHPGEVLKEMYIEPLGLTITEAAQRLSVPRKKLSQIVNGKAGISPVMALRLAKAFENTSPQFWLNMQNQYDLWQARNSVDLSKVQVFRSGRMESRV
jgi:addiction module HigA family antidote